jgi:hypothetical protein
MRRALLLASILAACSKGSGIPADRPALGWFDSNANRDALPKGPPAPDERACAADPTRQYIGELFRTGINDVQVNYHWAPIVQSAPRHQPQIALQGTIVGADDSGDDVLGDHPFGTDIDADVKPDAAYAFLAFPAVRPLHTEVENRIFPRAALGFTPQAGDRVLMKGDWALDCGHPPYEAELHPPGFLSYARSPDANSTIAATVIVPYRSSLLFNPNPALAADFANDARFANVDTKPFSQALVADILHVVINNDDRLTASALMVPNTYDKLDWLVCAPLPKPRGARLDASWRFTARTGVTIAQTSYPNDGCVRFTATMGTGYVPMALPYVSTDWPWDQLSASASGQAGQPIDVRQEIINILAQKGIDGSKLNALQPDHPPRIDAYPALTTRAGADKDSPANIDTHADDQPFPLYGRVRVAWIQ